MRSLDGTPARCLHRRHVLTGGAAVVITALGAGGCDAFGPAPASAQPTPEEAVAEARAVSEAIAAVRGQYRETPSAGTTTERAEAEPRVLMPTAPAFDAARRLSLARTGAGEPSGSRYGALFDGTAPVDHVPMDLQVPEDVYWSFAVFLEQGRADEAFDLLDASTQDAVRAALLERARQMAPGIDDPATRSTRDLWRTVMAGVSPPEINAVSLRTARTRREAQVIVTPLAGEEIPIRFTLDRSGWRMNLEPYVR